MEQTMSSTPQSGIGGPLGTEIRSYLLKMKPCQGPVGGGVMQINTVDFLCKCNMSSQVGNLN